MDWLTCGIIRLNLGNGLTLCVKRETELVNCAFFNDLASTFSCIVLNYCIAHRECVIDQITTVQVLIIHVT